MKPNLNKLFAGAAVAGLAVSLALAGISDSAKPKSTAGSTVTPETTLAVPYSFAPVVKKVGPSVVQVYTTTKARSANTAMRGLEELPNPLFRWFYGDEPNDPAGRRRFQAPPERGAGSGVIVSADGYLLTNNHVVENADEVKVVLSDKREFSAKVVGNDPQTDVAVLKIEAKNLPAAELADSDALEIGDVVLAVGNPFGIGQTVTTGIVSAKGRATLGLDYEDFIQTDAAINPGNSGGALVDATGRLVGINTAIISRSGGNQGIGFAIPTNLARNVMDSLIKDGRVTRSYIGVMIQDVTPALAQQFELKETSGALVGEVKPDGPAAKAGLKSGDVIVEFGDRKVTDSRQLKFQVAQEKPGTTVGVKVIRDGGPKTLKLTFQEMPGKREIASNQAEKPGQDEALNGVTVDDLDAQSRRSMNIPTGIHGAVVTEVEPNSASYAAGVRPGDVIQEINRQPVKNSDEAVKLSEKVTGKTTLLRVWSKGGSRFLVVDENKAS